MKIIKQIRALCALVIRVIVNPICRYFDYWQLKLKWWGLVRFTSSATITPKSTFEGANSILGRVVFSGNMGYGSYICDNCKIEGTIGRFCSIAADVKVVRGTHPITFPYATTSPIFFSVRKQTGVTFTAEERFNELLASISIGNDCWIGQRVLIVGGVKIGDGAVVLAGAVVTKDVPPYSIVGGVPAKILRYRYDEETIKFLLDTKWWNLPIEWLKANSELLCDIEKLKKELKKD